MASEHEIRMNFELAKKQAAKLESIAENIKKIGNTQFPDTLQKVSANWKGDNSNTYINKGNRLSGDITKTANSLSTIAEEIRTTAERIYRAEMNNLQIANNRKY